MKKGFTLAEILITLGIIGVIAALTIPTLVANTQKTQTVTKLQKFYSNMSQAFNLSIADNGPQSSWNYGAISSGTDTLVWFNTYLAPYLKFTTVKSNPTDAGAIWVYFQDGTKVSFRHNGDMDIKFFTDGDKKTFPGKNTFMFLATPFRPYPSANPFDRNSWKTGTLSCTDTGSKFFCAGLIMFDGWKIADDYPW